MTSRITDTDAQLAGFDSAFRTTGPCQTDASISAPTFGIETLILAFIILIVFYLFNRKKFNNTKKNSKALKKKR